MKRSKPSVQQDNFTWIIPYTMYMPKKFVFHWQVVLGNRVVLAQCLEQKGLIIQANGMDQLFQRIRDSIKDYAQTFPSAFMKLTNGCWDDRFKLMLLTTATFKAKLAITQTKKKFKLKKFNIDGKLVYANKHYVMSTRGKNSAGQGISRDEKVEILGFRKRGGNNPFEVAYIDSLPGDEVRYPKAVALNGPGWKRTFVEVK